MEHGSQLLHGIRLVRQQAYDLQPVGICHSFEEGKQLLVIGENCVH
jgi:hypothetical protein